MKYVILRHILIHQCPVEHLFTVERLISSKKASAEEKQKLLRMLTHKIENSQSYCSTVINAFDNSQNTHRRLVKFIEPIIHGMSSFFLKMFSFHEHIASYLRLLKYCHWIRSFKCLKRRLFSVNNWLKSVFDIYVRHPRFLV